MIKLKRLFEWFGGISLLIFSFYLTDQVSQLVINNTKLMSEIKAVASEYNTTTQDAVIDISSNEIVPGKYGKTVNEEESYQSMRDFRAFNKNFLVYDYIKPQTSLFDNKDKIIKGGNASNREISIIANDHDIIKYLVSKKICLNVLSYDKSLNKDVEYINANYEEEKFNDADKLLEPNKKICLKGYSNLDLCIKNEYYIIKPSLVIDKQNAESMINKIASGYIILLDGKINLEYIDEILDEIQYRDLNIVFVSTLIDEKSHA